MSMIMRFSGSSNISAKLIKLYTWDWCSHCEMIIDNGGIDRLYGAHPDTGVNYRPLNATNGDRVEEYRVETSDEVTARVVGSLLSQQGKPYDYIGLIGFAFHRDWQHDHNKWWCSEIIAWAFDEANYSLLNTKEVNRLSPRDIRLSPFLNRIS